MRLPPPLFLSVAEPDGVLYLGRDDLLKYAGPGQLIASALMLRLYRLAFAELSPDAPPARAAIRVLTAFPGDGILACSEMITRAWTQGRLTIDVDAGPPEAPEALPGRFYFEIRIGARGRGYWVRPGFFGDAFRNQVIRYQDGGGSVAEQADYLAFKQELVGRLLAASDASLFAACDLPTEKVAGVADQVAEV